MQNWKLIKKKIKIIEKITEKNYLHQVWIQYFVMECFEIEWKCIEIYDLFHYKILKNS